MKSIQRMRGIAVLAFMFALTSAVFAGAYSAKSYVQEGLYAQWDGIENAGWGTHDSAAQKPIELVGGIETTLTGTMAAGKDHFTFGRGSLSFVSDTVRNAVNGKTLTVEIVAAGNGEPVNNGGFYAFGENEKRGLWLWQGAYWTAFIHNLSYRQKDVNKTYWHDIVYNDVRTFTFSSSPASATTYMNGTMLGDISIGGTDMTDSNCYLGVLPTYNTMAAAKIYSIRIYTKTLSADEIEVNAKIDAARFSMHNSIGDEALFSLSDGVETASSYAQDGLIAQWDGIENVAYNAPHDNDAAYPAELKGGIPATLTGTVAAGEKYFTLGSGYLTFTSEAFVNAINEGNATVEIVMEKNGTYTSGGFIELGPQTRRGFWLSQQPQGFCNRLCVRSTFDANQNVVPTPEVLGMDLTGVNTMSFRIGGGTGTNYLNGAHYRTFSIGKTDVEASDVCRIGGTPGNDSADKPNAKVYSVRIYNRALSAAEIAANAAIDRRRFGDGTVGAASYVRDKLLAQWDGAENCGYGICDVRAASPMEIASGRTQTLDGSMTTDGRQFTLGTGQLIFKAPDVIRAINEGGATVEIAAEDNGAYVHNGGLVAFGESTRGFWLYQQNNPAEPDYHGFINGISYHAAASGEFNSLKFSSEGLFTHTFALGRESSCWSYTNGFRRAQFYRFSINANTADDCRIGQLSAGITARPNAKIYSIRVYGKELSDGERENNEIVDTLRFRTDTLADGASVVPADGASVRVASGSAAAFSAGGEMKLTAVEGTGVISIPEGTVVGTHVALVNGARVARGCYTGSGKRGKKVPWLSGSGFLLVADGLFEDIPGISEFPQKGLVILFR